MSAKEKQSSIKQLISVTAISIPLLITGCAELSTTKSGEPPSLYRARLHKEVLTNTTDEDIKAEIKFGRDVAARVLGRYPLYLDKELSRYVSLIGTALAAQSSRTELNYYFAVLDSKTVNAYSAPGGYIFITKGALEMAQDEAELAAILAHEIAHITERHIVDALNIRATDTSGSAGLGRLISAGTDTARVAFMQAIDEAVGILFEKGYSQQDELDSDRVATLMLANAGYDARALHRYLTRTQSLETESSINTTHPPSANRLKRLEEIIVEEMLDETEQPRNQARFKSYVKK